MFIRKTVKRYKNRTYTTHLLVESVSTAQGPRQRTICSLGDLSPGPREKWLGLANRIEAALQGQMPLDRPDPLVDDIVSRIRSAAKSLAQTGDDIVAVHTDQVRLEKALLDGDEQMVGQHTEEDVGLDAVLEVVEDRSLTQRALHVTQGRLDASQKDVEAPRLLGRQVFAIRFQ